jgi:methionyl-tRNA formyltransferase
MSIVFFGTPLFSVPSLEALMESGEEVSAVVTRPDKRRGRGGRISPSPVKEAALKRGLRVLQPKSMKDEAFIGELRAIGPEFIVVVAYGRILTQQVLDVPSLGPINLHASLLPKYRGASPIAWAIINGEEETGLTTMFITLELDEGDTILQEKHRIYEDDTTESLGRRLSLDGGPILLRTLKGLRDGSLKGVPQTGEPSHAPLLRKEDGRVDWSKSAREVYNFVRGMHPWPGAFCFIGGERVKLLRAGCIEGEGEPGRILSFAGDGIRVGSGSGVVYIYELQPEGKGPMPARAFVQGRKIKKGMLIK